ncbi:excinuclease ABC subunit UvrA [Ramlibacter sp. XY19]|uniref:excinuclease ABC subunit UvrA n=1 Tax=Ramlibacter paludis TaxID=2908000 RepID=UPI0023DB3741|nr:excinuclease ABC subunit UvrA [Ramlibacter paludis]MCG2591193.1 excinuclease ABC subunit UvrA [Ramlibacter paludis]
MGKERIHNTNPATEERSPPATDARERGYVRVRGAREHNLKDVDVDIPRDALVVFSGVSGSGKSSLAFGTIYAEAQRRYLESVSPYARRLIDQAGVPEVDSIDGLPPAVALQQQRGTPSTRSSVGSVTTLSSILRMLYSRVGHYPPGQPMLYAEDFSPNTPQGACPRCHGQGRIYDATEASMVPDDSLTIRERAIAAWPPAWHGQNLRDILVTLGYDVDTPWRELPKKVRDWILFTDETPTVPVYPGFTPKETKQALRAKTEPAYMGTFTSARNYVLHTFAHSQSAMMKKRVSHYMVSSACPACEGKRLKREALQVTFAGYDIGALSQLPIEQVLEVLRPAAEGHLDRLVPESDRISRSASRKATQARVAKGGASHAGAPDVRLTSAVSEEKRLAAQRLGQDAVQRLQTLRQLGLGYLTLERSTPTLSPGELQRLRLATQLGSQLFGVIYVLDEPSAGLHPADGVALLEALQRLKASGNSVYVVEHDLALMRNADWLVDVGPAAGERGGEVLYSGEPAGLAQVERSQTRRHLFGEVPLPRKEARAPRGWLRLEAITRNNLDHLDAAIPLGCLTAVTGVSGSGKSTLVSRALLELVAQHLGSDVPDGEEEADEAAYEPSARDGSWSGRLAGDTGAIRRLVQVDQKPIGRTPRSNLATYTGLFDAVRKLFAATPAARRRRYDAGRFSFNVPKGRCDTCEGEGFVSVELLFMPSVYAPCPACHGARYNAPTLEIQWNGKSIAEVLAMTVEEAAAFFAEEPAVQRPLQVLLDIGLGYLRLGQPATELSGGEAQRIKLATELQRMHRGDTLYVLDEPTTGLHASDADRLMAQLQRLVDEGNTVVVVEHEMRVVAQSDWVIDMGPGAGEQGGRVVAAGTPEQVARVRESRTAHYLAECLAESGGQ